MSIHPGFYASYHCFMQFYCLIRSSSKKREKQFFPGMMLYLFNVQDLKIVNFSSSLFHIFHSYNSLSLFRHPSDPVIVMKHGPHRL